MSYNLLNYPGSDSTARNTYFRTTIASVQPEILVVQEVTSQSGVTGFLNNVLNSASSGYSAGTFIDGYDSDNAVFYKSAIFEFISNYPIKTALRDINEFTLRHKLSGDTLRIYSAHLKSSSGADNELKRAKEVDSLRKRTDALHSEAYFIVLGDFNIYSSNESAYQKFVAQTQPGYFIDPINLMGSWNVASNAHYHTQSPRIRSFGGGSTGGLDDRFDMILVSQSVYSPGGITYVTNSLAAYGNDGMHYNDSINRPPNSAVEQKVADALHYASDHLPVIASFNFGNAIPVELSSFTASSLGNEVLLKWQTETEIENFGFEIQRRLTNANSDWQSINFMPGNGNSTTRNYYNFSDKKLPAGIYFYRLKQIDNDGSFEYSEAIQVKIEAPREFYLFQNYPNPFNSETQIEFQLPQSGYTKLILYNSVGEIIKNLVSDNLSAGGYKVSFKPDGLSSGVYFYSLENSGVRHIRKMTILN